MLYTIISPDDIFYPAGDNSLDEKKQAPPSSNPFDYVSSGYYLDNAALFGGKNYVHYHCDLASHSSAAFVHPSHQ